MDEQIKTTGGEASAAPAGGSEPASPASEQPLVLPVWVAPAIGIALVAIAGMAAWTGFRQRTSAEVKYVLTGPQLTGSTTSMPEESGGAPGDPGPGASRLVQSDSGGEVPRAEPIPEGDLPRAEIRGDASGVVPTASLEVRRGIAFDCDRPDAMVYVNELPIGEAGQFAAKDQPYEFSQEGSFSVRVVARDGTETRFTVVASAGAETDVKVIAVRLAKP
ncbi:MAG: hypothetical protein WC538_05875 [Thermoanaerobaculia bacterium]|jgi:hypothetical protein